MGKSNHCQDERKPHGGMIAMYDVRGIIDLGAVITLCGVLMSDV